MIGVCSLACRLRRSCSTTVTKRLYPIVNKMSKLSKEEGAQLVSMFDELDLKPDMNDPEALTRWMAGYVRSKTKTTGGTSGGAGVGVGVETRQHYHLPPRIANFSGSSDSKDTSYEAWNMK